MGAAHEAVTLLRELGPWGVVLGLLLLPPPLLLAGIVIALLRGYRPWQAGAAGAHTLTDDQVRELVDDMGERMEDSFKRLDGEVMGLRQLAHERTKTIGEATLAAQLARQTAEQTSRALEAMGRSVHEMSGRVAGLATQVARLAALLERRPRT